MAFIYKITNDINGKVYIGKTLQPSINHRWADHCAEYERDTEAHRPLYAAMRKYGLEHFKIEQLEECSPEDVNEREKYWIEQYCSFKYGYNATKGGDGRAYLDYNLIIQTYKETLSIAKTAQLLSVNKDTVSKVLQTTHSFSQEDLITNGRKTRYRAVGKYDKDTNELLQVYPSLALAEQENPTGKHITDVCNGRRKTAGGYIWKFIE